MASWGHFEATRRAALGALTDEPAISSGSTSGKAATRRRSRWCGGSASPIRPLRRRLAENPGPTYPPGSLEWQRQQERNDADKSTAKRGPG
jgi:hypothetical protein